jgi:hypothetical protein
MNDLIQDELLGVLKMWRGGEAVTAIALGHSTRVNADGGEERHVFRQKKVYGYVFDLIEQCGHDAPLVDYVAFNALATDRAHEFQLSAEEQGAGKSLAWVALHRGWKRALSGFPEGHSITVKAEAQA